MTAPAYRCTACSQVYFPTSLFCPVCGAGSEQTEGVGASPENGLKRILKPVGEGIPRGPWLNEIARKEPFEPAIERRRLDQFTGALVGTACGDAMGVPVEGQAPSAGERHAAKLARANECGETAVPYFSTVYTGRYSDDTQQARAIVEVYRERVFMDAQLFAEKLGAIVRSGRARGWGASSMRAVTRIVSGEKWSACAAPSGECGSAPVMRVVPVGALLARGPQNGVVTDACAQSSVTHSDPRCTAASVLVALAASDAVNGHVTATGPHLAQWASRVAEFAPRLAEAVTQLPVAVRMERADAVRWAARCGPWGDAIADEDVCGIPGTAGPIALFAIRCWLRSPHAWLPGVLDAISAGGDTDTAAAVTGGLLGASLGASAIPPLFALRIRDVGHGGVGELTRLCVDAWKQHRR